jgi:hypothetical protein
VHRCHILLKIINIPDSRYRISISMVRPNLSMVRPIQGARQPRGPPTEKAMQEQNVTPAERLEIMAIQQNKETTAMKIMMERMKEEKLKKGRWDMLVIQQNTKRRIERMKEEKDKKDNKRKRQEALDYQIQSSVIPRFILKSYTLAECKRLRAL